MRICGEFTPGHEPGVSAVQTNQRTPGPLHLLQDVCRGGEDPDRYRLSRVALRFTIERTNARPILTVSSDRLRCLGRPEDLVPESSRATCGPRG